MTTLIDSEISEITLDIGERKIYNDIRTECDVTDILTVRPDATPDLFEAFTAQGDHYGIPPSSSMDITVHAAAEHSEIVWLKVVDTSSSPVTQFDLVQEQCSDLGGVWHDPGHGPSYCFCSLPSSLGRASYEILSRGATSCTVRVTNQSSWYSIAVFFMVSYQAVTPETRYIKIRVVDDVSIAKYGRRTLSLRWYVGQTPSQMRSIIEGYRDKKSEPVPMIRVVMVGKTDALVSKILGLKIDDKLTFTYARLNVDDDFWVNNLSIYHDINGLLEAAFDLENVNPYEEYLYFKWDDSKWDEAVWTP